MPKGSARPCPRRCASRRRPAPFRWPYGASSLPGCTAFRRRGRARYAYGIQAARAGSHAILAWMLDDNSFTPSDWGMWSNHRAGMVLRPWFYTWSLFTRYVPPGSTVYRPPQPSRDLRILASRSPLGEWTFYVVNRGDSAAHLLVRAQDSVAREFRIYEYSRVSSVGDADG